MDFPIENGGYGGFSSSRTVSVYHDLPMKKMVEFPLRTVRVTARPGIPNLVKRGRYE